MNTQPNHSERTTKQWPLAQHPVPPQVLVHIGDLVVSFALLENMFRVLAGSLIAEHQCIGRIITAELSFKNLRALVISLYKERHGEDSDYDCLRQYIKRAAQLEDKRNQIVHSTSGAGRNADCVTRIKETAKERHGIRAMFESVSSADVASIAITIKQLSFDIMGFTTDLISSGKLINNPLSKFWGTPEVS